MRLVFDRLIIPPPQFVKTVLTTELFCMVWQIPLSNPLEKVWGIALCIVLVSSPDPPHHAPSYCQISDYLGTVFSQPPNTIPIKCGTDIAYTLCIPGVYSRATWPDLPRLLLGYSIYSTY